MGKITEKYINSVRDTVDKYFNNNLTKIIMEYMKTKCIDCDKSYHFCDILIHNSAQCNEDNCRINYTKIENTLYYEMDSQLFDVYTNDYCLCRGCWYNYNCLPGCKYNGTPEDLLNTFCIRCFPECKMNHHRRFMW